jgi:hypothetical protein
MQSAGRCSRPCVSGSLSASARYEQQQACDSRVPGCMLGYNPVQLMEVPACMVQYSNLVLPLCRGSMERSLLMGRLGRARCVLHHTLQAASTASADAEQPVEHILDSMQH